MLQNFFPDNVDVWVKKNPKVDNKNLSFLQFVDKEKFKSFKS